MTDAVVMLVDNGSRRAAATRSLRALADALGQLVGGIVHPVSLQHADRIPPEELDGQAAQVFESFLREHLTRGDRDFVVVPLFFGPSRALSSFIPEQRARLEAEFGAFELRVADVISPAPHGEPRLAGILADQIAQGIAQLGRTPDRVIVVDHGSPLPAVTAVRDQATEGLRSRLAGQIVLSQAVMERRPGAEYDFNGELLGDLLERYAGEQPDRAVVLGMMFISPGRHAGEGGDIEEICADAMQRHPGLHVVIAPLVGEHPALVEILAARLAALR